MAKKANAKAKAAPKATVAAVPAGAGGGGPCPSTSTASQRADNGTYFQTLQNDVNVVLEHCPELRSTDPLGLVDGGSTVAFKLETMMSMYSNTGVYNCGLNLCMLSLRSPTPELPLSVKKKTQLVNAYYMEPRICDNLKVGIDKDISKKDMETMLK